MATPLPGQITQWQCFYVGETRLPGRFKFRSSWGTYREVHGGGPPGDERSEVAQSRQRPLLGDVMTHSYGDLPWDRITLVKSPIVQHRSIVGTTVRHSHVTHLTSRRAFQRMLTPSYEVARSDMPYRVFLRSYIPLQMTSVDWLISHLCCRR